MTADTNGEPLGENGLRYEILGEDGSSPVEKLAKYTGEVEWRYLRPHFEANALVYVDASLSLTEVGQAFSDDDTARVEAWKKRGDLVIPSRPHVDYWDESGSTFRALVVSPFVLIQPADGDGDSRS